jgi:hypothetical protein
VLTYHVVSGNIQSKDLDPFQDAKTAHGSWGPTPSCGTTSASPTGPARWGFVLSLLCPMRICLGLTTGHSNGTTTDHRPQ